MQAYEIRILHADRSTDMVLEMLHFSDNAAVRAGKKIAGARPFEVWRDLDCIYGVAHRVHHHLAPRRRSSQP